MLETIAKILEMEIEATKRLLAFIFGIVTIIAGAVIFGPISPEDLLLYPIGLGLIDYGLGTNFMEKLGVKIG